MSAIALAEASPVPSATSPDYLCDAFLSARDLTPRGALEPWSRALADRLARAAEGASHGEISACFDQAAAIAAHLDRHADARRIRRAAIAFFTACAARGGGPSMRSLALFHVLGLGRVERALGRIDDALYTFERLAALPLGGSITEGPLSVGPEAIAELSAIAPDLPRALARAALLEALSTVLHAGHFDLALRVARVNDPAEPPALTATRREAMASALCRMGFSGEALVFLASAIAREAPARRPLFEQKRAEALAASGQTAAARARALGLADALLTRLHEGEDLATLDDLHLAARVARLLGLLGDPAAIPLAVRALGLAQALGDVPLEADLATQIVESAATSGARALALQSLRAVVFESGHRLAAAERALAREGAVSLPSATTARAPSFPFVVDALLKLTP
jgi:hypothetical protein